MKRILLLTISVMMLGISATSAQEEDLGMDFNRGWYVGAQAGLPMAEADLSSFGADKFRLGWNFGIHGGYRFTPTWSLEVTGNWGQQFLAEQACCNERDFFLGTDHNRYREGYTLPSGMSGWYYRDLKSRTTVQRYGMQVNMNILGFFKRTKEGPWRVEVAPAVYAAVTSSDLMTKADKTPVANNLREVHLGYGGQAQVSYAITKNMNLGIYGGFTHFTGDPMDGMPELHTTNYVIDAGVKFSFAFGKKRKPVVIDPAALALADSLALVGDSTMVETLPVDSIGVDSLAADSLSSVEAAPVEEASQEGESASDANAQLAATSDFPVIYFSFNSIWIEWSERDKVEKIAEKLKADESVRVRIIGWGDEVGGVEANKRVSLQRAETVKRVLGQSGISADRIEAMGGGINYDAPNRKEARNATTFEIIK